MGGLKIGWDVSISPFYRKQETRRGKTHRVPSRSYEQGGIRSLRTIPEFVERETCGVRRARGCPSVPGGLRRIFEV
jgi:hypothetical protein